METINNNQLQQNIIEDSQNFPELRLKSDQIEIFDTFLDTGAGKSPNFWKDHKKLLDIAGYQYKQIDTEKLNHANEIILKMSSEELLSYQGIVTFSGDGLPHEIINAIQQRDDKEQALQIGISALPGGSGNALATSICKKANEQIGMISSIYALIKGNKQKMDLIELQIDDQQKKIYSFISINYAYIADCDINSEKLRCLGGARFDVYGFYRCLIQKKYPTKIYMKKQIQIDQQQNQQLNEEQQVKKEDWDLVQGNLKYLVISNTPYIGETINSAPLAEIDNGYCDIQILNNTSYISLYKFALTFQNGTHFDIQKKIPKNKDMYYTNAKEFIIETDQKDSLFSIDGEKFTAQNLKGKVIPQALSVFTF